MRDTATVSISVMADNNAPVAVNDFFDAGCLPITRNIIDNDYDPDGDKILLALFPVRQPAHGKVTLLSNGSMIFGATKGYSGTDSLWYEICDDGFISKCDTGKVYIDIFVDEDCDDVPDAENGELFIPEGFSPNGDGIHDYFQIRGIEAYPDATLYIFNRWGNKLFEKKNYGNLSVWGSDQYAWWDGYSENKLTIGNEKVPPGNYLYILDLGNGDVRKGTVMVSY